MAWHTGCTWSNLDASHVLQIEEQNSRLSSRSLGSSLHVCLGCAIDGVVDRMIQQVRQQREDIGSLTSILIWFSGDNRCASEKVTLMIKVFQSYKNLRKILSWEIFTIFLFFHKYIKLKLLVFIKLSPIFHQT